MRSPATAAAKSSRHKLGQVCAEAPAVDETGTLQCLAVTIDVRGFRTNALDPQSLVVIETAFDEAWLTLKAIGNNSIKPDELARSVLRLALEGERDPVRLHDGALQGLLPATTWREAV